jgi:hypothetical protein
MTGPGLGEALAWLRTPAAIRQRCGLVLAAAERDELRHFALDLDRLAPTAAFVVETIRQHYPTLAIPYHSRWRHFAVGGWDRWAELAARSGHLDAAERARLRFDLAVVSVLLDAGAGDAWRYREAASGQLFARSEGLAVASFDLFAAGACSSDPAMPWRADAVGLRALTPARLAAAFQVGPDNPLIGLEGRARLLNALADALAARPALFGQDLPRIGHLFDHLGGQAVGGRLPAAAVLEAVLIGLGPIWPGRIELGGANLGDVGRHPAARADGPTDRLVPLHKLSQWLTYSLLEPLEEAGIEVTGLDELTALAEYRNGGLLIDLGLLRPKHAGVLGDAHPGSSEVVVEWRALTVALIDWLADDVRAQLGVSAAELPLAKILEGGTWNAGRRIARERREGGGPPLRLLSDGTLF